MIPFLIPERIVIIPFIDGSACIRELHNVAVCVVYKNHKKNCGLIFYGNADIFSVEGDSVYELFNRDIKVDLHLITSGYPNLAY